MALTSTILTVLPVGAEFLVTVKAQGDASYPTGGYAVTPALFGLNSFMTHRTLTGAPPATGNYTITDTSGNPYSAQNATNGNLQLFVATTGAEVANATNETTFFVILEAIGH